MRVVVLIHKNKSVQWAGEYHEDTVQEIYRFLLRRIERLDPDATSWSMHVIDVDDAAAKELIALGAGFGTLNPKTAWQIVKPYISADNLLIDEVI